MDSTEEAADQKLFMTIKLLDRFQAATREELIRKFLEEFPPDGHLSPGLPAWTAQSMVKALLAGMEEGKEIGSDRSRHARTLARGDE